MVLDDHDRAPLLDQLLQDADQPVDVGRVQADRRLVQDVERRSVAAARQLARELDALGFTARESRRRLPDLDVAQADVVQRLQLAHDRRDGAEEAQSVLDRQVEDLGDRLPLEAHLQRLPIEARPVADLARHIHVRQELHLDAQLPLTLARLATSAAHVEGETAGLVAAHLGLRQLGEERADGVEDPGVGPRVGARRAPDRALVDVDDLVDVLDALQAGEGARLFAGAVQRPRQGLVQHLDHQRRLAGPGDAGDADELSQGNPHRQVFEIVLAGADDHQRLAVARTAGGRRVDA